ncbi:amino acid adenylation domain-containing protein [Streptomyces chrestomyceticus]|uniref:amino acid adenylation domain-containing protein n=1 Tax=Streptomyces chrestomyceticus TaxID=68185 RepID=UPI003789C66D
MPNPSADPIDAAPSGTPSRVPADREELRRELATAMGAEPSDIEDGDNLISLGLNSIKTMQLVTRWRRQGTAVTFAELMTGPNLDAWWRLLCSRQDSAPAAAEGTGGPAHIPDPSAPFALTPVQHAYWIGRKDGQPLGGVGCHGYFEFDGPGADPQRLEQAVRALVARHGMLRVRVLEDGRQQVTEDGAWPGLTVHDLTGVPLPQAQERLGRIREDLSHRRLDLEHGEVFDVRLSLLPDGGARLHLNVDLLIADVLSIQVLLADLAALYNGAVLAPVRHTFSAYLAGRADERAQGKEQARKHWQERIPELPVSGPQLPLATDPARITSPRFTRRSHRLPPEAWQRLAQRSRDRGLTPSMLLATAFAEILGRWSSQSRFVLNVPLFDRHGDHPDLPRMVADFTSLLLLEVDTTACTSFAERARQVQARFHEDVSHADHSAVDVLRELGRAHGGPPASAPVVFASSIGGEFVDKGFQEQFGDMSWMVSQTPQVWLDHQLYESQGGLLLTWDSVDALFPDGLVDTMFTAYGALVDALAAPRADWDLPAPDELPQDQAAVRAHVNATGAPVPEGLLHDGLLRQARRTPERTAVIDAEGALSYGELLTRATAVADRLRTEGCTGGELVAVAMPKSRHQIAAVLGVLLAGCAYLPVDVAQPAARRDRILADAGVRHVLVRSTAEPSQPWPPGTTVVQADLLTPGEPRDTRGTADPDGLAYVIYTSGSTGAPKGVMISHRAALNTVEDINSRFSVTEDDRVLGLAGLSFDLSVYDIFGPPARGGALVLPDPERRGDPSHWAELAAAHRVTLWNSVPAQLQMLDQYLEHAPGHDLSALRLALLSGDWIPVTLPGSVRGRLPGLDVVSLGGATEAAIWSIHHPVRPADQDRPSIPYGLPLTNQTFHVLDARLRPCPDWVPGELYIGGTGLALGYLGDPERTAERFVTHPADGQRLYRTGDMGRYLPDGEIEFLGRTDAQVKIRGHRVEPAEVEAALAQHPTVGSCCVIVDGSGPADRRLAAFATPAAAPAGRELPDPAWARQAAAEVRRTAAEADEDGVRRSAGLLTTAVLRSMAYALHTCGAFGTGPGEPRSAEDVLKAASVAPRHHSLVRRWLSTLVEADLLGHDPATGRYSGLRPVTAEETGQAWLAAGEGLHPQLWSPEVFALFRRSAENLPALLRGELDQARLLFPEGDSRTAVSAFTESLVVRCLNRAAAALLRQAALDIGEERPLRVLEIGAGVGGTSVGAFEALAGRQVEYLFTDVSQFFLNEAQERFADVPFVDYALFDVNGDHRTQGFDPNSFDVILAANVLHNARHIGQALGRLRELLAPGGTLVLTEATDERPELMISMDFLVDAGLDQEGFQDVRKGRDQVLFTEGEWTALLTEAGGAQVLSLPEDDVFLSSLGQHLLAARFKTDRVLADPDVLMRHLVGRVPAYMLPSRLQVVDELPLTVNGKLDHARLRSWLSQEEENAAYGFTPPEGPLEQRLAGIWAQVLGIERVGRDQSFFDLGGDSLLIAQLVGRLREQLPQAGASGFDELLVRLMDQPTVAASAAFLGQHG